MSCITTLKEKGMRLTPQRMMIVDILHDRKSHLTAEEIVTYVQARMPGINKSTVYRTLELLEHAGCVYKSEMGNHFIYHHDEEGHHHHLVCSKCGKTIDCDENLLSKVEKLINDKYRFRANFKHVVINGLCNECASKTD